MARQSTPTLTLFVLALIGLQLVGRFRDEWTLLRAAALVADALGAVGRRPPAAAGQRSTK